MGNTVGVRHYFIEAFTPYGYISLLPELLKDVKHTYFLTGGPGTGKSTMIKLIGIQLIDRGYEVDYIRSIREPDSVAGFYLSKYKICLLDKNEFVPEHSSSSGEYHREIDFSIFCRKSRRTQYPEKIKQLESMIKEQEEEIVMQLGKDYGVIKETNADWTEGQELVRQDSKSINTVLALKKLLSCTAEDSPGIDEITEILSKIKKSFLSFYFLHGIQLDGWLNLAPRYLKDFDRICLEGVESVRILRDILKEVRCLGQVMEIIVHPLKPYTVVGIVFPGKNLAVWKGNPCRQEEQGFVKKHSQELAHTLEQYRKLRVELKNLINDTVIFKGLDDMRSELLSSILADLRQG